RIDGEAGIRKKNFVTRLDERHHRQRKSHLAAGRDEDLFRNHGETARASEIVRNGLAQRRNAARGAIAVAPIGNRFANGIYHGSGGMKVRAGELQMNDGAALPLEFLGAGKDGKSAFSIELRNTRCDTQHKSPVEKRGKWYHFAAELRWRGGAKRKGALGKRP